MASFVGHRDVGSKGIESGGTPAMTIRRRHSPLNPASPLPSIATTRATVGDIESRIETSIPPRAVTRPRDTVSILRSVVEAPGFCESPKPPPIKQRVALQGHAKQLSTKGAIYDDSSLTSNKDSEEVMRRVLDDVPIYVSFLSDTNESQLKSIIGLQFVGREAEKQQQPIKYGFRLAGADLSRVESPRVTPWPELWQTSRSGLDHWSPNSRLYQPLAVAAVILCLLTTAAAATWAPQLRIGSGFAGFTLGVAPIPLRRDERVTPASLIPIYVLSLACTAIFITLQYYNIARNRGQYLFGTFVLAAHFTGVLSQASDKKLDGIIDLGPAILPAVAALVSLLFLRHQPTFFRYPRREPYPPGQETHTGAEAEAPQREAEADIALESLTQLSQAATGLMSTGA